MPVQQAYATVNGLKLYYEIHGGSRAHTPPLVLIHGGGSTIPSCFGRLIPLLVTQRQVIALEMQAHGRTADRDTPLSFAQDADDAAALMDQLGIATADVLGFSNGGQTCIELGLRHAPRINRLILCSAFYNRSATPAAFWQYFEGHPSPDQLPAPLRQAFLDVNPNEAALRTMFNRDVERMRTFTGWTDEQMRSIHLPVLLVNAQHDVGSTEHAAQLAHLLPQATLAVLPGGHGTYLGERLSSAGGTTGLAYFVPLLESFLDNGPSGS